jgi:hypothetical protein
MSETSVSRDPGRDEDPSGKTPMSAGSNAPVAVDGDYVIAGAGAALSSTQRDMLIAYKLGATGKLPETVGS